LPQISPFSIETELLLIYPAELRFASQEEEQYISLTNKTDDDVVYAINDDEWKDYLTMYDTQRMNPILAVGVVPPRSTCAVSLVPFCRRKKPYSYIGVMMISGSRRYRTGDSLRFRYTYEKRDELMNQVRADGGNVHEAVLACVIRSPHPVEDEVYTYIYAYLIIFIGLDLISFII
jgi:hypothetical protein